jgi:hypothetical protein
MEMSMDYESKDRDLAVWRKAISDEVGRIEIAAHHAGQLATIGSCLRHKADALRWVLEHVLPQPGTMESKSVVEVGTAEMIASALRNRAQAERSWPHPSPMDIRFAELCENAAEALMQKHADQSSTVTLRKADIARVLEWGLTDMQADPGWDEVDREIYRRLDAAAATMDCGSVDGGEC